MTEQQLFQQWQQAQNAWVEAFMNGGQAPAWAQQIMTQYPSPNDFVKAQMGQQPATNPPATTNPPAVTTGAGAVTGGAATGGAVTGGAATGGATPITVTGQGNAGANVNLPAGNATAGAGAGAGPGLAGSGAATGGATLGANAYNTLLPYYQSTHPGNIDPAAFNSWAGQIATNAGVTGGQWENIPTSALAGLGNPAAGAGAGAAGAGAGAGAGTGNTVTGAGGNAITTNNGVTSRNLGVEGATTLQNQLDLAPQQYAAYNQYSPLYAQTDLNTTRNTLFGSVNADQFLSQHPEFKQGYDNAKAGGQNPQQWLDQAVNTSTYLDQANVPRGGGMLGINQVLTKAANDQTVAGNTALRAGNVADAQNLGGSALGILKNLNPNQYNSLDAAQNASTQLFGQPNSFQTQLGSTFSGGPQFDQVKGQTVNANANPFLNYSTNNAYGMGNSALGNDIQTMAREQLALGSGLSDEQKRNATQAAREGWGARGLINSNGAVGAEVLNRDAYGQQLLAQRQNFAGNANQLGMQQQNLNNQYGLGLIGANLNQGAQGLQAQTATAGFNQTADLANQSAGLQSQQQNNALGLNLAQMDYGRQGQQFGNIMANANLQSANAFNPFNTLTSAGTANQGSNPALFGQGYGTSTANNGAVQNMFNPYNSYSSDLFNTNYNAQVSSANSAANNSAAKTGAWIQGGATVAAKLIFMCIPEGEFIDTPTGQRRIESIKTDEIVTGYRGAPVRVMQVHQYKEDPNAPRFYRFFVNGGNFSVCDKHRICGSRSEEWQTGQTVNDGINIVGRVDFGGVRRSYDLVTEDGGYRMSGVAVNSMVGELMAHAEQLQEA